MKRIVRLTESDLSRIVRRVISEQGPIGVLKQGNAGPLTGQLMVRNPRNTNVEFGDTIEFKFTGVKNAGQLPITIYDIVPMNDNMTIKFDKRVPFEVQPGQTFGFTAIQKLVKGGTATENMDSNGRVNYEQRIMVKTNGKKANYILYCVQELIFFDGMR